MFQKKRFSGRWNKRDIFYLHVTEKICSRNFQGINFGILHKNSTSQIFSDLNPGDLYIFYSYSEIFSKLHYISDSNILIISIILFYFYTI